jgi:hypothetical protein
MSGRKALPFIRSRRVAIAASRMARCGPFRERRVMDVEYAASGVEVHQNR